MPDFDFIATDHHGRNFRGSLSGPTEQAVYNKLQKLGYVVLTINKREKRESIPLIITNVSQEEIAVFTRLLSAVISAGMPVNEALLALEEQIDKYILKKTIREVRLDVEAGMSLSNAFEKHPKIFPLIFVSMIRSGEIGGNLPEILDRLSGYLERDQDLKRSLKSATLYPKVILFIAVVAVSYMMRFVVPKFVAVYQQANMVDQLSWTTKLLMKISTFATSHGIAIIGGIVGAMILFIWFKNSSTTRVLYDRFIMSLPILGRLSAKMAISRTIRSLGSMLECAVPILDALDTSKMVLDNKVIEEDIERIIESVELGGNISTPIRMSRHFPPLVVYMTSAGEQSGQLYQLLKKCAEAMEKELEHTMKRALFVIEILLIVLIAIIIGFIAISVYLPIFELVMSGPKM